MTISTTVIKNSYNGDGSTTAFTYTFKIVDEDDIQVIIRASNGAETVKTKTTHYTVSGVGNSGGGTITFTAGNIPVSTETVILRRSTTQTQEVDLIDNDPLEANTLENALDKSISIAQELQEQIDRSIKLSRTNTMASTEFTVDAATRANKILAFDSSGEIAVTQELGTFRGNWSASTVYYVRDLIKDTSNNNIYICNTAHTSSGSQPISSNADTAKWNLIVDAASASSSASSASSSASAAAASAAAALVSENNSATSESNALSYKTDAETAKTASETAQTAAENAQAAAEAALDTFDDKYLGSKASNPTLDNDGNALTDGALYFNTTDNVMKVYDLGTTTWKQLTPTAAQQTNIDTVAGEISPTNNISTVAGINAEISTVAGDSADIQTLAGITNLNNLANSYASVVTAANNLADINAFANIYLGPSATAPTLDPDGSALDSGDLYFSTTDQSLKVYGSSGWQNAGSSVNGTSARFKYTATSGQTTFTGNDDNGNNLSFDPIYCDVFLNGVKLVRTSDYTDTSGSSIVLTSGAATSDILEIIAYGTFTLASISINDLTDVTTGGVTDGQVLTWNASSSTFQPGNASSAEVYGFNKDASGNLIVTTTDGGNDNISSATYASFDDVLFAASGFTFSLSNGDLIATI